MAPGVINKIASVGIIGGIDITLGNGQQDIDKFKISLFPESRFSTIDYKGEPLILDAVAVSDQSLNLFPGHPVTRLNVMIHGIIDIQIPAMRTIEIAFMQQGYSQCFGGRNYVYHKISLFYNYPNKSTPCKVSITLEIIVTHRPAEFTSVP